MQLLPKAANIDACWVNLPNRSLDDVQVSAEYVAYNIRALAAKSKTKKIAVIGHSQGRVGAAVTLCADSEQRRSPSQLSDAL